MYPGQMSEELGAYLSRNDDKVNVKETDQELMVRVLRTVTQHQSQLQNNEDWMKDVEGLIKGMVDTHHNVRDAMLNPDVLNFYLYLYKMRHFDGSKVMTGSFASSAFRKQHGTVSNSTSYFRANVCRLIPVLRC